MSTVKEIDIEQSWLSDHPMIKFEINESLNLGVFNVLSDIASGTGVNANRIDEKAEKLYSCLAYIEETPEIFKGLVEHVLNNPGNFNDDGPFEIEDLAQEIYGGFTGSGSVTKIGRSKLFKYENGIQLRDDLIPADITEKFLNEKLTTRLLSAAVEGGDFDASNITFKKIFNIGEYNEKGKLILPEGDIRKNYLILCQELDKVINNKKASDLKDDSVFKTKNNVESYILKEIHQVLIDKLLQTGCMGGFEFQKKTPDIHLDPDHIKAKKKEFLEKYIKEFFEGKNPDTPGILVCPEFDQKDLLTPKKFPDIGYVKLGYYKDLRAMGTPVDTFNKLELQEKDGALDIKQKSTESFVLGNNMEMKQEVKSIDRKYQDNDFSNNFCRVVFFKNFELEYQESLSINTSGKDKFVIDFLIFKDKKNDYLICFSVHLNSVPIEDFENDNKYEEISCVAKIIEKKLNYEFTPERLTEMDLKNHLGTYILGDFNFPLMNKTKPKTKPNTFTEVKPEHFKQTLEPKDIAKLIALLTKKKQDELEREAESEVLKELLEQKKKKMAATGKPIDEDDIIISKIKAEAEYNAKVEARKKPLLLAKKEAFLKKKHMESDKNYIDIFNEVSTYKLKKPLKESNDILIHSVFNSSAAMPKRRPFSLSNAQVEKADSVPRVYNTDFLFELDFGHGGLESPKPEDFYFKIIDYEVFPKKIEGVTKYPYFVGAEAQGLRLGGGARLLQGGYKKKSRKTNKKNLKSLKNTQNNLRKSKRRNHKRTNKR